MIKKVFVVRVVFPQGRTTFPKIPQVKHRIYFMQPNCKIPYERNYEVSVCLELNSCQVGIRFQMKPVVRNTCILSLEISVKY